MHYEEMSVYQIADIVDKADREGLFYILDEKEETKQITIHSVVDGKIILRKRKSNELD